jgi:hypothetical protein
MSASYRGRLGSAVAVLVALASPGLASSAAATPRPTLSAMALQASDLPAGSQVAQQGYGRDGDFVASSVTSRRSTGRAPGHWRTSGW